VQPGTGDAVTTPAEQLPPHLQDRLRSQLARWRQDLLALDRRQRLLYFSHTRTASLEITGPTLSRMLALVEAGRVLIEPESELGPVPSEAVLAVGNKTATDLPPALRRLDQQSNQVFADRGFWPLYLALGMLQWVDPDDGRTVVSPVLLVPVRLRREATHQPYRVTRTEDELVVNPALRLKMEKDFDVELPAVDEYAASVDKLLDEIGGAVAGRPGWAVLRRAVLTTFSFHKEAIYRDLLDHEALIRDHPLVQLVALGPDAPAAGTFAFEPVEDDQLDTVVPPERLVSILDADGSQRKCILAARDGRSFVVDGPPGTGKSQTIANIIVELIAIGHSVLFVSEKVAALDVVRKRLADAGLDEFLLALHSHSATRKQVVAELAGSLRRSVHSANPFGSAEEATLVRVRGLLTGYADAMNGQRPGLGRTLHEVLGRVSDLTGAAGPAPSGGPTWSALTAVRLDEVLQQARALARAWRPVSEGADYDWRDLRTADLTPADMHRLAGDAGAAAAGARGLVDRISAVDTDLGVAFRSTADDARRRVRLLDLVSRWPEVPADWLTVEAFGPIADRIEFLRTAAALHRAQAAEIEARAGRRWSELDGDQRFAVAMAGSEAVAGVGASSRSPAGTARPGWAPDMALRASEFAALVRFLESAPQRLVPVAEDARRLAGLFGMPVNGISPLRADDLARLASLGEGTARPDEAWFHPALQRALDESCGILAELVEVVRRHEQSLAGVFTREALALDLAGLQVRFTQSHTGWGRFSRQGRADRTALKAVTVAGKVRKAVLARLGEAVAWQQAERRLTVQEPSHAPRLGSYYRRTDTDFGSLTRAVQSVHEALRLAGQDLNGPALARQLGRTGQPDPALTLLAARLGGAIRGWRSELWRWFGDEAAAVDRAALGDAAQWCVDLAAVLRPNLAAVAHVAEVAGRDVTVGEAADLLARAANVAAIAVDVYDAFDDDRQLLGPLYQGLETGWDEVRAAKDWTLRVRELTGGPVAAAVADRLRRPTIRADEVRQRLATWDSARDALCAAFAAHRAVELAADLDGSLDAAVDQCAQMAESAVADIDEWCRHVRLRIALAEAGLGPVVEGLARRRASADLVPPSVERAVLLAWADAVVEADDRLRTFRTPEREDLVAQFRRLDDELIATASARVAAACGARRPRSLSGAAAQRILREAQKKTRHIPIRELLAQTHALVQVIKPCFMMSPLSVSQYLPPAMRFDVVIFDEASQVMPSDAVNSMYRGSQLIVAGDQKQLPPTSFFARAVEDDQDLDDSAELDVFQSVLDLCKAGALPSTPLTWHYRSRHEALITYSNYRFYDGELHTFPGATFEAPDLGVASYVVDGVYRRGGARDNPIEAQAVVDRVVQHLRVHPGRSIGVVTFSAAQEDAVLAVADQRAAREPLLAEALRGHDRLDGFFVKALENVQGDERDIIIFSVGYGPDEAGKLTMNFGPLNRDGGWRRLNVAITRARRRVEIISSFRAEQMPDSGNPGVRHLRGYLDFAARGMPALAGAVSETGPAPESPFEQDVLGVVRGWGYEAEPQVGSAGYRIDIAVRHPRLPGRWALAVECDGAMYHSAKAARDRDRLREKVLRGLGWQVHRIWGVSWVREREGQKERLRLAIEAAVADADAGVVSGAVPEGAPERPRVSVVVEDIDLSEPPAWTMPYRVARPGRVVSRDEPDTPEARPRLRTYFQQVLAVEAPIHESLLLERLRADWGIGRVGSRIRANAEAVLAQARVDGRPVVKDGFGVYRVQGRTIGSVRVPTEDSGVRTVVQVPPEELELAVANVVADAVVAHDEQVSAEVSRVFGWRRQGADIQATIETVISRLLTRRLIERGADGALRTAQRRA
jgi:very-short-patch-repair endonuclease